MSRSIDQRIVEMRFDNAQFEKGAKDTMSLLDRLKEALKFGGAKDGFRDIQAGADGVDLNGIAAGVDNISDKFSVLGAIGFSVLQDLTRRAIDLGSSLASSALDPIIQGGRSRALNMEQAEFQFEGLGMDVEATMENALEAVKGTAYGLDEAAVLAANFGATGMEAGQDMADALRGVSGVAAMAGASYEDVGNIFGKVAGQGRLMGDDLNRLAARGVNAAATMADQMGITEAEFRDMVSQGEITFDMFAQGMNEAFGDHATKANETYTGSLSNMQAALARVGAEFFTPHLTRQRDLFNALTPLIDRVNDALGPLMTRMSNFLDLRYEGFIEFLNMLDQDHTGGRILEAVMRAIGQAADTLMSFLSPIGAAFAEIFGGATIDGVVGFTDALTAFLASMELSSEAGENLQRTFAGIFAVFDIGFFILGEVIAMFGRLIGVAFEGTGGFLEFTAGIGDFLVGLRDAIKEGTFFSTVIGIIEGAIRGVIGFVQALGGFFASLFSGLDFGFVMDGFRGLMNLFPEFGNGTDLLAAAWEGFLSALMSVGEWLAPAAAAVVDWAAGIGPKLVETIQNIDWHLVLDIIKTALLGGLVWIFRDSFTNITDSITEGFSFSGLTDKISDIFGGLTSTLTDMQNNLKADTLIKIAGAIAVLTASVAVLSTIDGEDLTQALAGLTVMMGQMMGALWAFSAIATSPAMLKMPFIAASLGMLAGALLLLSAPVYILSRLDWDELAKGLLGVAGMMVLMAGSAQVLSAQSGSFLRIGVSMIPFAAGLVILSEAVRRMADLSWHEIGRGLAGVAGGIIAIGAGMRIMPTNIVGRAIGLTILAGGLLILSEAVESMGSMQWDEIGRGLTVLGGSMLILAGGLRVMGGTLLGSAALTVAAVALTVLVDPLKEMASLGWEEIGKVMTTLGGSLGILAGGLYLMSGTLLGAASLIVAAGALSVLVDPLKELSGIGWEAIGRLLTVLGGSLIVLAGGLTLMSGTLLGSAAVVAAAIALGMLTPVLITLSELTWGQILSGIGGLAIVFGSLAISAALLTPFIPSLFLLGAALLLISGAMVGAGVGMAAFAAGFATLVGAVAGGGSVILDFLEDAIALLPRLATALANAMADFIVTLAIRGAEIAEAFRSLGSEILQTIRTLIPEFVATMGEIISAMLEEIRRLSPEFRETFTVVLLDMIGAFEDVYPEATTAVLNFIEYLLGELEQRTPGFVDSGMNIVRAVIQGILNNLGLLNTPAGAVVFTLANGLISNVGTLITTGMTLITSTIGGMQSAIPNLILVAYTFITTFVTNLRSNFGTVRQSGWDLILTVLMGIRNAMPRGVQEAITTAGRMGRGIITGIIRGIRENVGRLIDTITGVVGSVIDTGLNILGINSPSRVFMEMGKFVDEGLALGIENNAGMVTDGVEDMGNSAIDSMKDVANRMPGLLDDMELNDPVIKPVLDLSDVRKDSRDMSDMLNGTVASPYSQASTLAQQRRQAAEAEANRETTQPKTEVKFDYHQNISSPEPVSTIDIYRHTKNQLSRVQEGVENYANTA